MNLLIGVNEVHKAIFVSISVGYRLPGLQTAKNPSTKGRFPLPELTARVDWCQKMLPSSRAINSAREVGP